ncbi:MAG: hypothetical protein KDA98_00515 [Acidimicrobiales bacterium]|nr:hypothetical protein [Acidimicrobiales bacterium]
MNDVAGRARWLGSPVFLVATAVLLLNDHVFKERFGGVVTGKLSDIAGVVVVGVVAAVVLDARRGMVLTAVAFSALKVVPGVAEAVAPVLGGVTRRDATDLIAVAVLVPLGMHLTRSEPAISRVAPAVRVAASSLLPVLGASVALVATTATSCAPDPAVVQIIPSADGVVVARVAESAEDTFLSSADGGRTWNDTERPAAIAEDDADPYEPASYGPLRACTDADMCLELEDDRRIVRVDPEGRRTVEFELSGEDLDDISTHCAGAQTGVLTSIGLVRPDGVEAVASLGAGGVVARDASGEWSRVPIFPDAGDDEGLLAVTRWLVLGFGPLVLLAVWLAGPTRLPSRGLAVAVAVGGWCALITVAAAVMLTDPSPPATGRLLAFGLLPVVAIATVVTAVAAGRRDPQPPPPPPGWYPPPPPPPPPST